MMLDLTLKCFVTKKTAGGGWTVLQKRLDGTVDFHRNWSDYKKGFGNLKDEFWLGVDKIFRLTKSPSKLRVDLEDFDSITAYAEHGMFAVENASEKYQLRVETCSGTCWRLPYSTSWLSLYNQGSGQ